MDSIRKYSGRNSERDTRGARLPLWTEVRIMRASGLKLIEALLVSLTLVVVTATALLSASPGAVLPEDESLAFCKRIFGPDTVCTFSEETWKNGIHMHAMETVTDIYVKDVVPAEFDVEVNRYTHGDVLVTDLGQGQMGATKIEWWIDELQAGEQALLVFTATTRLNPAGHQEFTSPGIYEVNPGYDIHWTFMGEEYEGETQARTVVAIECP